MAHDLPPTNLFIDGKWVDSSEGKTFDAFDPRTGAVVAQVHQAGTHAITYADRSVVQ